MKQPRRSTLVLKVQVPQRAAMFASKAPELDSPRLSILDCTPHAARAKDVLLAPKSKAKKGKARHNHHA